MPVLHQVRDALAALDAMERAGHVSSSGRRPAPASRARGAPPQASDGDSDSIFSPGYWEDLFHKVGLNNKCTDWTGAPTNGNQLCPCRLKNKVENDGLCRADNYNEARWRWAGTCSCNDGVCRLDCTTDPEIDNTARDFLTVFGD